MAPPGAGATYAACRSLSSVTGRTTRQRRIYTIQCARTAEQRERHIDRWRHGATGDGDPQRLRYFAKTALQPTGEIVEEHVYRRRIPLGQSPQLLAGLAECVATIG